MASLINLSLALSLPLEILSASFPPGVYLKDLILMKSYPKLGTSVSGYLKKVLPTGDPFPLNA